MKLVEYILDVSNAALGRRTEGFTESMDALSPVSLAGSMKKLYFSLPILFIFHVTVMLIYGLGAARLSYCYQMATNPNSYLFYVYVYFAFIFSPVYYPFYAIVLNPHCMVPKNR